MSYIYGKPFKQRDGWHYWGKHDPKKPVPEVVGPFKTEEEAQAHADKHGSGKPKRRKN